jgi:integrase
VVLQMSRPWRHPRTGMYWFRKAIPADLRQILQKREEKFSLRTKSPGEAQALHAKRAAEIAEKWARLRGHAAPDHVDIYALAGEFYREMLAKHQRNPGDEKRWLAEIEKHGCMTRKPPVLGFYSIVRDNREFRYKPDANKFLAERGYVLDRLQFSTFIEAFAGASKLAAEQLLKNVKGDYTPDPNAQRFPKLEPRMVGPELDLLAMWEKYSRDLQPASQKRWRSVMRALEKRFGRDLATLSFEGLVSWRDELIAQDLSATTIREVYLAAVRWILNRCVKDRKLLANVAFGIEVKKKKIPKLRDREFTMEEVSLILRATLKAPLRPMSKENAAARRWIPWILAYTGARLNEITQARQSDLERVVNPDDRNEVIWMLDITPEAGTVKTGTARKVPLHPHLIEQGFLNYAQTRTGLPLFYDPKRARKKSQENPYYKKVGERLGEWVHSVGIAKDVQPSHAWRHLFKSIGRYAQIPEDMLDTLQGHQPRGEGAKYGSHWPQMSYQWIKRIPRFELNAPSIADVEVKVTDRPRKRKVSRFPKKAVTASTP